MKVLENPKSRIALLIAFITLVALTTFGILVVTAQSERSPSPLPAAIQASTNSTTQTTNSAVVDDYPPSRFQSGRPSRVTGLTEFAGDGVKKTITLKWNLNPANEKVDEYAIYYHNFVPVYPSHVGSGVLAAVVKKSIFTLQIIKQDLKSSDSSPYGAAQIPVCTVPDDCFVSPFDSQRPFEVSVWVIAHNERGWGNNDPDTPNPDENPDYFSELSGNQDQANGGTATSWNLAGSFDLTGLDPSFETAPWPEQTVEPSLTGVAPSPTSNSSFTVPWLPNVELPTSRFGPGRPRNVTNLISSVDFINGILNITWDANPPSEGVDSYAIYAATLRGVDDVVVTTASLIGIQSATKFSSYIPIDGLVAKKLKSTKGISNYFIDNPTSVEIWVIAHNKKGWGDNDPSATNPDQKELDYRPLSNQESLALIPPTSRLGIGLPCSIADAKAKNCADDSNLP